MAMCGIPDKLDGKPIILLLQHSKRLPETEITHHVKSEIIAPIRHILAQPPSLPLLAHNRRARAKPISEGPHVLQNIALHSLHSAIREGMRKNTALARMLRLIDAAMRVIRMLVSGEGGVEVALLDGGVEAVDAVESGGSVGGEVVGAIADEGAVFLVHEVEGEVAVAVVGVVDLVPVCDLCEEGTGVGG